MITIFQTEHYTFYGRDENDRAINKWVKQLAFFVGDLTSVDLGDDRFKAVGKVRKEAKLLGTVNGITFPVVYPIHTNEGAVINDEYDHVKYEDEGDYNAKL